MLYPHTGPEVEVHRLTQYRERTADERLARHDGRTRCHKHGKEQHAVWHDGIKRVVVAGCTHRIGKHPRTLTEIVEDEHNLDKNPADGDVVLTAMSKVGIKGLGTRGTEENGSEHEEPHGRLYKQTRRIIWIKGLENLRTAYKPHKANDTEQHEPQQHECAERTAYMLRTKTLHEEHNSDDGNGNRQHGYIGIDAAQSLYGCGNGDGRRYHSVGQQRAGSYNGYGINPTPLMPAQQCVESQYSALAMVVGTQCYEHILYGSLQRKRPDYARKRSQHVIFCQSFARVCYCFHHIQG